MSNALYEQYQQHVRLVDSTYQAVVENERNVQRAKNILEDAFNRSSATRTCKAYLSHFIWTVHS
jgi:hypothetical protein